VMISTERDLQKSTAIRAYDIRDLLVYVPNFTDAPEFDLGSALDSGGGGGGAFGSGGDDEDDADEIREEMIESITTLIRDSVGQKDEWQENGGTISAVSELNGNLIVKTTSPNHRQIANLLSTLREMHASQISVESRFLVVDDNFLEEIGIDLDFGYHFDYNINPFSGAYEDFFGGLGQMFRKDEIVTWIPQYVKDSDGNIEFDEDGNKVIDNYKKVTMGEAYVPIVRSWNDGQTGSVGDDSGGLTAFQPITGNKGNQWGPVNAGQNSANMARRVTSDLTPGRFETGNALSLSASFLDDLEVNLIVNATQGNNRAISLTAPRITFFNGQRAYVVVAQQIAFISDLEVVPDGGFDPEVSYLQTGVVLDVEGTISADRRYVTMTLRPGLASLVSFGETTFSNTNVAGAGSNIVGIGTASLDLPEVEVTQIRTTVSVPDRGTLMIGGQRLLREREIEVGVPVLSKIPIINRFFTNNSTIKDERTLLILVKPTIILQDENEEENFPGLLQNPEMYNLGQSF
jgi:type II secretory pathway component GspD/PulD (secretin)